MELFASPDWDVEKATWILDLRQVSVDEKFKVFGGQNKLVDEKRTALQADTAPGILSEWDLEQVCRSVKLRYHFSAKLDFLQVSLV